MADTRTNRLNFNLAAIVNWMNAHDAKKIVSVYAVANGSSGFERTLIDEEYNYKRRNEGSGCYGQKFELPHRFEQEPTVLTADLEYAGDKKRLIDIKDTLNESVITVMIDCATLNECKLGSVQIDYELRLTISHDGHATLDYHEYPDGKPVVEKTFSYHVDPGNRQVARLRR